MACVRGCQTRWLRNRPIRQSTRSSCRERQPAYVDARNSRDYLLDVSNGDARASPEALTLDTLRAARNLALRGEELQTVLATDAGVVQSLMDERRVLTPESSEGRRALLLVRLHRALGDVFGSLDQVHVWLDTEDAELRGRPRELIRTADGLANVVIRIESRSKDPAW